MGVSWNKLHYLCHKLISTFALIVVRNMKRTIPGIALNVVKRCLVTGTLQNVLIVEKNSIGTGTNLNGIALNVIPIHIR